NIYASDLEEVLLSHPEVAEAAVFAVASRRWGETPGAVAVLKPGASMSAAQLRAWANSRLGRLQHLAIVAIADQLPRGALDKVLKRELRAQYAYLADQLEE
ncbi:MAG TPA: hypothetical protein VLX90_07780, partial [Steroidobacteraceae bacterium]|nr:hypothetical protein [Steroidobacteraceae bacterium]